jgi:hypothetical protein
MKRLLVLLVFALAAISFTAPAMAGCYGRGGGFGYGYRTYRPYVAQPYAYGRAYLPYSYYGPASYGPSVNLRFGYGGYGGYGYPYYGYGF